MADEAASPPYSTPPETWTTDGAADNAAAEPVTGRYTNVPAVHGFKRKRGRDSDEEDTPSQELPPTTPTHLSPTQSEALSRSPLDSALAAVGVTDEWMAPPRKKTKRGKKKKREAQEPAVEGAKSNRPALRFAEAHRQQSMLKISDLQALVLYCLADGPAPQWVGVQHHGQVRRAVVLMVPGLELGMFDGQIALPEDAADEDEGEVGGSPPRYDPHASRTPDSFLPTPLDPATLPAAVRPLAQAFARVFPVKAPGDERYSKLHSSVHAMLSAPVPRSQEDKRLARESGGALPLKESAAAQRTPIAEFLLGVEQMLENEYVLHPRWLGGERERALSEQRRGPGWVDSRADGDAPVSNEGGSLTQGRCVYSVDCEMCMVGPEQFAVTRVSVVDWGGEVVMDELVKPDKPIVDYLTPFSGITEAMLRPVTTTLPQIQARLLDMLSARAVLVGHSLDSDLRALKLTHPFLVDTSILYPHPRGPPLKSSLKWLAQRYLHRSIQQGHGAQGHDSVEDARAALDLVKQKCERGPAWGEGVNSEAVFRRIARARDCIEPKHGAVVDHGAADRGVGALASHHIACASDDEVVEGVRRAVLGDPDGAYVPGGGVAFTWARLRELESLRGWEERRDDSTKEDAKEDPKGDGPKSDEKGGNGVSKEPTPAALAAAVAATSRRIAAVRDALPPCSLLLVYSGQGDARDLRRLQALHRAFRHEYATRNWDQLSVRWTDVEDQALREACAKARRGVAMVCVT